MKKIIYSILFMSFLGVLIGSTYFYDSSNLNIPKFNKKNFDQVKENGSVVNNDFQGPRLPVVNAPPPAGAIPGLDGYMDYTTNGNSLNQVNVSGSTVIVAAVYVDSVEAPTSNNGTTMRSRYNYSTDGGVNWELPDPALDLTTGRKSRYPDIFPITNSIAVSGRMYGTPASSTDRLGGCTKDVGLGIGSVSTFITPGTGVAPSSDAFGHIRPDGKVGIVIEPNGTDSLVYWTWDPSNGNFSGKAAVFNFTPPLSNTVASYTLGSSTSGNHMTIAAEYINEPSSGGDPLRSVRYWNSTDNGVTWSSAQKIAGTGIINGDSTQPYWHNEIAYKPNSTTFYVAFSTADYTTDTTVENIRKYHKICVWSAGINGGNPVVVADWHNMSVLSDVNLFRRVRLIQVNSDYLSHPSLGFSTDGNVIFCTFSAVQPDTNANGYTYEDCFYSYSTDQGATWSTPVNYTNTQFEVEKYPVVAETGNSSSPYKFHVVYQWDLIPGCAVFNDFTEVSHMYEVYTQITPPIGIKPIGKDIPMKYELYQNFPNPFNPTTKIRFAVPLNGKVTLKVYNILGKEVATLLDGAYVGAGTKEIDYNPTNLASGVYFYKLTTDKFTDTKKMVLVK